MENSRIRFEFSRTSFIFCLLPSSGTFFVCLFTNLSCGNFPMLRYWYSSLHMAAQYSTSRDPLNLSIFYSNDNFIVSLLCSCVRDFFILFFLLRYSSSVQQLNTEKRLSQKRNANFKHGASMWWRKGATFFSRAHNAQ